ncbi:MAG: ATP-grasp domain-containing protein [Propionicimonas sp.]|nr:ATP-grasp domain-containing protein [Propionicimonas sp.]
MRTLLITGVGGPAGIALGKQLRERAAAGEDLEWVGVDIVGIDSPDYPATGVVPRADDPDYPRGMRAAFERYRPDLIIPTVSDELPQLAVLAETLGLRAPGRSPLPSLVLSSPQATAVAADKLLTMWALEAARVPIPRYAPATDFRDAASAIAWGEGPVVVKPRVSRGGRGVVLLERPDDLDWSTTGPAQVVQTFAGGSEYSPQVYRSPLTGETTVVVLHKTELKEGRVGNAVSTVRVDNDAVADVVATAAATVAALDLVGPIDMDIRRDEAGVPVVLEVNARFGANSARAPELLTHVLAEWLG